MKMCGMLSRWCSYKNKIIFLGKYKLLLVGQCKHHFQGTNTWKHYKLQKLQEKKHTHTITEGIQTVTYVLLVNKHITI